MFEAGNDSDPIEVDGIRQHQTLKDQVHQRDRREPLLIYSERLVN